MAYLIESVKTMLGAHRQNTRPAEKYFLQAKTNHLIMNIADSTKSRFPNKKATAQRESRVAFRLKPASFVEFDCTASTPQFKRFVVFARGNF
jgi:hypothetical protein